MMVTLVLRRRLSSAGARCSLTRLRAGAVRATTSPFFSGEAEARDAGEIVAKPSRKIKKNARISPGKVFWH
jgi:hypothetical protein